MRGTINICQPGYGASCALCCGSHNIALGRAAMHAEFSRRTALFGARGAEADGAKMRPPGSVPAEHTSVTALHDDAICCPFVGFIDADRTLIGCLVYSRPPEADAARGFFERTCRTFSCPARETLDDAEALFAARLTGDWYYYGLLINSIPLLRELIHSHGVPGNVPDSELRTVKRRLETGLSAAD